MLILAVDTSSSVSSLALSDGEKILAVSNTKTEYSHSESLSCLLKELLSSAGVLFEDLNLILLGKGPGSFTGLRSGYALAKGVAAALKIPIYEISSLHAVGVYSASEDRMTYAVADARRKEVFISGIAVNKDGETEEVSGPEIVSVEDLSGYIKTDNKTSASVLAAPEMIDGFPYECLICPEIASGIIKVAVHKLKNLNLYYKVADLCNCSPDYIRQVSAKKISERKS